ncbi:MAG: DUF4293 domain-containing protein [Bacteroidetes bacterium]|nr:DUF4293 domain-containing protein [Bacteroidota bacterium]
MIQRIQSLYLLVACVLGILLFFIPVYSLEAVKTLDGKVVQAFDDFNSLSNPVFLVLTSASCLVLVVTISLFKNRNLQVRLCNLSMLLICIFTGTVFYFSDHSASIPGSVVHYRLGCYFPLVQLILCFLAMRAIRKDEELVRSAERLR